MMPKMLIFETGVYKWVNLYDGKIYIGGAYKDFGRRKKLHQTALSKGRHSSIHFQRAWELYGEEAFDFVIIERCPPLIVKIREQFWLDLMQPYDPKVGYNICKVAGSSLGIKRRTETRQKLSEARKGISPWNKGIPMTEEAKKNLSERTMGRPSHNKGVTGVVKLSAETKAKMSANRKGEDNPASKLTESQVIEIREAYAAGGFSFGQLGRAFGVSYVIISDIVHGRIWKHIGGPIKLALAIALWCGEQANRDFWVR